jgi:hypothetical protein
MALRSTEALNRAIEVANGSIEPHALLRCVQSFTK